MTVPIDPRAFAQPDSRRHRGDIAATMPGYSTGSCWFFCDDEIALEDAARQSGVDVAEVEQALNAQLGSGGQTCCDRRKTEGELL